jgi:hypothetical protein
MADTEREDRARKRAAVEREMSRLRAADVPDTDTTNGDEDLVDTVTDEQRRARDAEDGEHPA